VKGEAHLAQREPAAAETCFARAARLDPTSAHFAARLAAVRAARER
jgi:hypothetical protein